MYENLTAKLKPKWSDSKLEKANLSPHMPYFRSEKADFGPKRTSFGPKVADIGPMRADFWSRRSDLGLRGVILGLIHPLCPTGRPFGTKSVKDGKELKSEQSR